MIKQLKRILGVLLCVASLPVQAQPESPPVIVSEARIQSFPLTAEALGNARANEAVDIRPEITAAITKIQFREGQPVKAGDVLLDHVSKKHGRLDTRQ